MKVVYVKGVKTCFELTDAELMVAYSMLSKVMDTIGGQTPQDDNRLHAILADMEMEIKKRVMAQKKAERFHLCMKCCKEIDTEKDKYVHHQFDSGYETYQHQVCPPINQGEGYAR